jgi:hypothetical protein
MKALMSVAGQNGPPSIEAAARQLDVNPEAIDRVFGIVPIDPAADLYSVLVEMADGSKDERAFSNPRIEPLKR